MSEFKFNHNKKDYTRCREMVIKHSLSFNQRNFSLKDADTILTYKDIWQQRNAGRTLKQIRELYNFSASMISSRKKNGAYLVGEIYIDLILTVNNARIRGARPSMNFVENAFADIFNIPKFAAQSFVKDFPVWYAADTGSGNALIDTAKMQNYLEKNG